MNGLEALRAASRDGTVRAGSVLALDGGDLRIERLLRALPDKRLVLLGERDGRRLVAKCFLAPARAEVHARREVEGLARLRAAGLAVPESLAPECCAGAPVLLSAFLPEAAGLVVRWPALDGAARGLWLARAAADLARLHGAGFGHADAHFGNLLADGETLVWLDGDAVQPLAGEAAAMDNLALLLAQLPALDIPLAEAAYRAYAAARGFAADWPVFQRRLFAVRRARLAEQLAKAGRECTAVRVEKRPGRWFACRRELAGADWADFIADPDALFRQPEALLKDGNSATVIRARLAGRDVVVKRYNLKSWRHGLLLALRPVSRALNAFACGLALEKLGLATPAPLAVLEKRVGPWRREAYLVCAHSPARDCRQAFPAQGEPDGAARALAEAISRCLNGLWDAGFCHGDLKASNVLERDGVPLLIDLDSMGLAKDPEELARRRARDRERFLRNFRERPSTAALFSLD